MTPRNFHISIYSNARSQFFRWRQNVVFRRVANELVNVLWLGVFSHDFERNLRLSLDYYFSFEVNRPAVLGIDRYR